jgi:hypothetical protein
MPDDPDDLDAVLRRTMSSLDRQAPTDYFDALPQRTLARLDDAAIDDRPTPRSTSLRGKRTVWIAVAGGLAAAAVVVGYLATGKQGPDNAETAATSAARAGAASPPAAGEPVTAAASQPASAPVVAAASPPASEPRPPVPSQPTAETRAGKAAIVLPPPATKRAVSKRPAKPAPPAPAGLAGGGAMAAFESATPSGGSAAGSAAGSGAGSAAKPKPERTSLSSGDFKRGMTAIARKVQACFGGTQGLAALRVTVAPSGRVTKATVTGMFAGSPTGACVERTARTARFPPWDGESQSFSFSYLLSD